MGRPGTTAPSATGRRRSVATRRTQRQHHSQHRHVVIHDSARALRWVRVLYYGLFAPLLLYGLYVQLVVLKSGNRVPIPASVKFGRDTVFLTFHGNFHCMWMACLGLLHALIMLKPAKSASAESTLSSASSSSAQTYTADGGIAAESSAVSPASHLPTVRRRSALVRRIERLTHTYTAPLFSLGSFVGIAYYSLLHFHPLTRIRARMVPDYDEKMALLHLAPALFVLGDVLLKDDELARKYGMSKRRSARFIAVYGASYFSWSVFCVWVNGGHWPYPFQPKLTAIQHITFVSTVILCASYMTRHAHRLMARLDRNRRKRVQGESSSRPSTRAASSSVTTGAASAEVLVSERAGGSARAKVAT